MAQMKTRKGSLGKNYGNKKIKRRKNKERVYQRFCPKIQTAKISKSRFEM